VCEKVLKRITQTYRDMQTAKLTAPKRK